ncbi:MAG: acetylxylan esterase, partial [Candidatus Glassbacteria bacterium]
LAWDRGTVAYSREAGAEISPQMPDPATHLIPQTSGSPTIRIAFRSLVEREVTGAFVYCGVTDFTGRGLGDFSRRINLPAGGDIVEEFACGFLEGKPGFYDVRVCAFDSGREFGYREFTFGYDVENLDRRSSRPPDFDRFWQATLDSLQRVPLAAEVIPDSLRSTGQVSVYRVSFASLHGVRVHGWYTLPRRRQAPYAALVFFPGYSSGRISPQSGWSEKGYATLSIQVRGYEVDRESYPADNSAYMTIGVEAPETYIYREIVCHCLRAVSFVASRPEVDGTRIGAVGGSQGGGLALVSAGLDPRIRVVAASAPFLTDFPRSLTMTGAPYRDLVRYIDENPGSAERVYRTVSYFDSLIFANRIRVPVVLSAGLFDRTCPAPSIYGLYLELAATEKRIALYPWLDHLDVWKEFSPVAEQWITSHLPPAGSG